MAIRNVIIRVDDLPASLRFYRGVLHGVVFVDGVDRAVLDFVSSTIELRRERALEPNPWTADDSTSGFAMRS